MTTRTLEERLAIERRVRHLLGAHPGVTIREAAERVARDALDGPSLRCARVVLSRPDAVGDEAWDLLARAASGR